ncbi:unnamed protein product [Paramecium pentaurelia]|uniref:Uncharacterized protein n=1 Tax=Paramecium pentaurelia TaxID=43138 RepID=A0A8S1U9G6_9CILI|nr:unnamed protein product [Paramecium pentaurelia]
MLQQKLIWFLNWQICIAITTCAKIVQKASCLSTCGYLQTDKCQVFDKYSDAFSTDQTTCFEDDGFLTDGIACLQSRNFIQEQSKQRWNLFLKRLIMQIEGMLIFYWNQTQTLQTSSYQLLYTDGAKCFSLEICSSYTELDATQERMVLVSTLIMLVRLQEPNYVDQSNVKTIILLVVVLYMVKNVFLIQRTVFPKAKHILEEDQLVKINFFAHSHLLIKLTELARPLHNELMQILALQQMKLTRVAKNLIWNYHILYYHICDTFAKNTDCQPVPSFDGQGFTVCTIKINKSVCI